MKLTYLKVNSGEIVFKTMKELKLESGHTASWERMHSLNSHKVDSFENKRIYNIVLKYLEKVSVFDFNNAVEYGYIPLFPHFVDLALKNGAIDRRN